MIYTKNPPPPSQSPKNTSTPSYIKYTSTLRTPPYIKHTSTLSTPPYIKYTSTLSTPLYIKYTNQYTILHQVHQYTQTPPAVVATSQAASVAWYVACHGSLPW